MDSIREPLERLVEQLGAFVASDRLRVLHVVTSEDLRLAALQHIAAQEHDPRNTAPFLILEGPVEPEDPGWTARCEELRADMDELTEVLAQAPEPVTLTPMPPPDDARPPVVRFIHELSAALRCLAPPLTGLVIVLAPVWNRDAPQWNRDLASLLDPSALAGMRLVVVDLEESMSAPGLEALGPTVETVDATVDPEATKRDLQAMLAQMASAPKGAHPMKLAGMAGPNVAPPPRPNRPTADPAVTQAALADAGIPKGVADVPGMQAMRQHILTATVHMQDGKTDEAVKEQRHAARRAAAADLPRESLTLELVAGGYALQGGAPSSALQSFERVGASAKTQGFGDLSVQAMLAAGSAHLVLGDRDKAAVTYTEAGTLGADMDAKVLGIEGYRMAGQLLADDGREQEASAVWRRALALSEKLEPVDQASSSAPQVARALAQLCRSHGLSAQATSLEEQAERLEAGPQPASGAAQAGPTPDTSA